MSATEAYCTLTYAGCERFSFQGEIRADFMARYNPVGDDVALDEICAFRYEESP